MKRCVIFIAISLVTDLLLSSLTDIPVKATTSNTLYTVSGVLFSISISMLIGINIREVRNEEVRQRLRTSMVSIRRTCISLFIALTAIYITCCSDSEISIAWRLSFSPALLVIIFSILCILYYSYNFYQMYMLNDDIEETVHKEESR